MTKGFELTENGLAVLDADQHNDSEGHGLSIDGITATVHTLGVTANIRGTGTPADLSVNTFDWAPFGTRFRAEVTGPHGSEERNAYHGETFGHPGVSETVAQWASDAAWIERVTTGEDIFHEFGKRLDTDDAVYFLHASNVARYDLIRVMGRDIAGWLMHGQDAPAFGYRLTEIDS